MSPGAAASPRRLGQRRWQPQCTPPLAVLAPETFATSRYILAADAWRKAVVKALSSSGQLAQVVKPYSYT